MPRAEGVRCRNCGVHILWGRHRDADRWVSLEPHLDGTWVRDEHKVCWKIGVDEQTTLPRYVPHMFLCAKHKKAANADERKPVKPRAMQLDLALPTKR